MFELVFISIVIEKLFDVFVLYFQFKFSIIHSVPLAFLEKNTKGGNRIRFDYFPLKKIRNSQFIFNLKHFYLFLIDQSLQKFLRSFCERIFEYFQKCRFLFLSIKMNAVDFSESSSEDEEKYHETLHIQPDVNTQNSNNQSNIPQLNPSIPKVVIPNRKRRTRKRKRSEPPSTPSYNSLQKTCNSATCLTAPQTTKKRVVSPPTPPEYNKKSGEEQGRTFTRMSIKRRSSSTSHFRVQKIELQSMSSTSDENITETPENHHFQQNSSESSDTDSVDNNPHFSHPKKPPIPPKDRRRPSPLLPSKNSSPNRIKLTDFKQKQVSLSDESDDKDYIVSGKIEPLPEPNQSYVSLISPPPSPSRSTNTENKFDETHEEPIQDENGIIYQKIPKSLYNCNSFFITRQKRFTIKGTSYIFKLLKNDSVLYSAKCKGRLPSKPIPITKGENIHLSTGGEFYLQPLNNAQTFYLFKDSLSGDKMLTASIIHTLNSAIMKRSMIVRILPASGMEDASLLTRRPIQTSNGEEILLNQEIFTLPSIKNSHFYNQVRGNESPDVVTIRKIQQSMLEINCEDNFIPIIVFGLALAVYIGNRAK